MNKPTLIPSRFAGLTPADLDPKEQCSVIKLALDVLRERYRPGTTLTCPDTVREYFTLALAHYQTEQFGIVFLDNQHRILVDEILFHGTIDGATIHPRVVVQKALAVNAAAVLMYHNHPSGETQVSEADKTITRRLAEALKLVEIRVLDHFIVGATEPFSFAEAGLL